MEELKDDEIELSTDEGTVRKRILFTCDYQGKNVVFFIDEDPDAQEVEVAYYDDNGYLEPLDEEDYEWAEEVLDEWQENREEDQED